MKTALISHPDCLLHEMEHSIPEIPARLRVIEDELIRTGLDKLLDKHTAPIASREQLTRVHSPAYVDYVFKIAPQQGFVNLDPDTWMNSHSLQAALYAAGAAIHAVDLVMSNNATSVYCNVRPPGHHAEKSTAMGFCIFNNIAIAAAHALEHHHLQKVAIIDFDAHHGNGIENIFKNDTRVLYCSSFEHPFYPFSGANTHSEHIINIPLAAGSGGKELKEQAENQWFQKIIDFKPEFIFFSAGFDAYFQDVMSNLMFNEDDYYWITKKIMKLAERLCHGRVVSALEGGYALNTLGGCVAAHLRALLGK